MVGSLLPDPFLNYDTFRLAAAYVDPLDLASGTVMTSNDDAVFVPFIFPSDATLYALRFWPTVATGNYDLGFYTKDFVRVASTGSTAMAALLQTLVLPEYRAKAGCIYYAALALSNAAATAMRWGGTATNENSGAPIAGVLSQSSALPLPNPAVPIFPLNSIFPVFAFGIR